MGKINWGRVILGGLVAGVVMNVGEYVLNERILGDEWAAAVPAAAGDPSGSDLAIFIGGTFLLAILLVWLYAAIRPRYGAGVKTAVMAGLFGWILVYGMWWLYNIPIGMLPQSLVTTSAIWGFFELPIATTVGAWLYKEEGTSHAPSMA